LCSIHIHSQHSDTLFPYTTLFRSIGKVRIDLVEGNGDQRAVPLKDRFTETAEDGGFEFSDCAVAIRPSPPTGADRDRAIAEFKTDRKSTRLNSSHVKISYAVFCLK